MSQQQLDAIIADIHACFGSWTAETTLPQMRKDWDDLFAKTDCKVGARLEPVDMNGVKAVRVSASNAKADRAVLYLHGGGYVLGSPKSHKDLAEYLSKAAEAQVFLLDYRLAPEHPFPAPVEDALAAYRWLLDKGFKNGRIAISGDSAGGGLTLATLVSIRDAKLPMPACATPLSPWVDMEGLGESMTSKDAEDPMVHRPMIQQMASTYLPKGNFKEPLANLLYADLKGLPPLLIQVGSRETLLDDSVRVADRAKKAGVQVQTEIEPGQVHVFQIFSARLDEGVAAIDRLGAFIRRHTG